LLGRRARQKADITGLIDSPNPSGVAGLVLCVTLLISTEL
jgi:hypothetical protein